MSDLEPNVYIIVVNWNNSKDTTECLESLKKVSYPNKKIILVDNHSTDNSFEKIWTWVIFNGFQELIHLMKAQDNLGFAGGNNVAIQYALDHNADYVLLLNNDTLVTPDFLSKLIETAAAIEDLGVLGCKIYHYPETNKVWYSGAKVNFWTSLGGHWRDDGGGIKDVDFVTGCLMLIPADVLKKVGLFDERFFLISEDGDLCFRIKKAGYRVVVNRDIFIYHKISKALGGGRYAPLVQYYGHRNRMLCFSKHIPFFYKPIFYTLQYLLLIPGWILYESLRLNFKPIKWALLGHFDFLRKRFGKCPYMVRR